MPCPRDSHSSIYSVFSPSCSPSPMSQSHRMTCVRSLLARAGPGMGPYTYPQHSCISWKHTWPRCEDKQRGKEKEKTATSIQTLVNASRLWIPVPASWAFLLFCFVCWTIEHSFTNVHSMTHPRSKGPKRTFVNWSHFSVGITCHQHPCAGGFLEL